MHLKNVRRAAMEKCYAEGKSFLRSIPEGVFTVGRATPRAAWTLRPCSSVLDTYHYEGWLVVEAEQDPAKANPLGLRPHARDYVRKHTGL